MFPIRDHNPSGRTPYVVYGLIAANVLVFLSQLGIMSDGRALSQLYFDWSIIPARISSGDGYHTLVSSIFLHGGWMHLAGNMLFLWIFGDNLEDKLGHGRFLAFYLACGIGAGLVHVLAAPVSMVPTVGASGAIAGVMGGYLLLFPRARVDILLILIVFFRVFAIPAWVMLAAWFTMQFIGGLGADPDAGGVAYWAHAGGFAIGLALIAPVWFRLGGPAFWSRTHGLPQHPETRYRLSQTRIPRVPRK
ncbi:rhomboid family intramembrane serine protease [Sedimentitalea sp. JM2-8]|uniref:Rhomboid family intramembrane serine protease n=1 Tax=Sedimentitalea xiamensis TaxID=3050037 RepID=A0ABT7FH19_9RHOB|nr:rhomboid family intramembrane serine protease [Sedimentitalea xiamensis]MDK3074382.1 rhomboid family intramembrane serine protease [Sedimentitalea xiamensis]